MQQVEEPWDDEDGDPAWESKHIDGAWHRTANPNTVDGELQNLAAFGNGLVRLSGPKRTMAKLVIWLILLGIALTVLYGIVGVVRDW